MVIVVITYVSIITYESHESYDILQYSIPYSIKIMYISYMRTVCVLLYTLHCVCTALCCIFPTLSQPGAVVSASLLEPKPSPVLLALTLASRLVIS